eukprot:1146309-Pelagomonas_calceolata.AAC.3
MKCTRMQTGCNSCRCLQSTACFCNLVSYGEGETCACHVSGKHSQQASPSLIFGKHQAENGAYEKHAHAVHILGTGPGRHGGCGNWVVTLLDNPASSQWHPSECYCRRDSFILEAAADLRLHAGCTQIHCRTSAIGASAHCWDAGLAGTAMCLLHRVTQRLKPSVKVQFERQQSVCICGACLSVLSPSTKLVRLASLSTLQTEEATWEADDGQERLLK